MGLEVATTIGGLVSTNPVGGADAVAEGDDHLRLLKVVLKTTFPNLNGVWSASVAEANYLVGVTSLIQTQLDAKLASASYTAADVRTKLLTVDGAGSAVDADLLDGQEGAYYQSSSNQNAGTLPDGRFPATLPAISGVNLTGVLKVSNNLSDVTAATARTNLGVTATGGDTTYSFRANNLSDLASAVTARANLGLTIGTHVPGPTGTGASGTWSIDISGNAATATLAANSSLLGGNAAAAFAAASHAHSGSDITSGTVAKARIDADVYRGTLGSGNITVQSGGSPSAGSNGDIVLIY